MRNPISSLIRRPVFTGVLCFTLGSLTLVEADTVPNGRRSAIVDAADSARAARVNALGELAAVDEGGGARLDALLENVGVLAFDDDGNLSLVFEKAAAA